MFDIGFSELFICAVIALIVLGPERLPAIARTFGRWSGQARAYMRNLSAELEREVKVQELRKQVEDANRALRETTQDAEKQIRHFADEAERTVQQAGHADERREMPAVTDQQETAPDDKPPPAP